jgi:radical SAM protein with 4Fe4S-binding SPASM domain
MNKRSFDPGFSYEHNVPQLIGKMRRIHQSDFPDMIPIDNISSCNLRCSMCGHKGMSRKPGVMRVDLFRQIIDEISVESRDTKIWMTFFGEAALLKDMPERIRYAKERGCMNLAINTNGTVLSREIAESYIKAGLDYLYVGVDAFRPETYSRLRVGAGALSGTIKNVLAYRDLVARHGNGGQHVFVQFVVMDENENEKEAFEKFWNEEGITVKFRPKVTWMNLIKADTIPKVKAETRFPCPWMIETLNIIHDGRIALCALDVNCVYEIDNVRDRTIKDVWNTTHKRLRESILRNKNIPEVCISCKDWIGKLSDYREVKKRS